ncbi:MAG: hydrolase [Bacteroidetes bacterium HGW-Bacteroidetes-1]|nr:MAG: hydrolase [Bacteroidetes bacterium HGW-Bacteroidetes-1]
MSSKSTIASLLLFSGLFFIFSSSMRANEKKQLVGSRVSQPIELDGKLDELSWKQAPKGSQFFQTEPYNGKAATFDTHVYVLFDDKAIYFGAYIHDPSPDSISVELRSRDNIGQADFFGVKIDPFNDGLNAFGFYVTARGAQIDMKTNGWDDDDLSWDAVWKSQTALLEDGWSVEIMIPYSALRFPRNPTQKWGINFFRSIQRLKEYSSWNFINLKNKGTITQSGLLLLPEQIEPPLRLSATPYLSASASHNSAFGNWSKGYAYGMDMKIGLSESFTLDMTLIPDFGQVESDDKIFSLSPFEVFYEEKRPFFTEGTELFSKGNVFYSRRVGSTPQGFNGIPNQYEPDKIISNPESAQLINAAKLSGKTSSGLAVGVFNAVTANTYAVVENNTGDEERILTEPFTNFNMMVVEQSLANNSQISLYNTNVYKPESKFMANVSGTEFSIRNKGGVFELYGMVNVSQHYKQDENAIFGERYLFNFGKIKGNFRPEMWFNLMTNTYNPNDMGFQKNNNEIGNGVNLQYYEFEPKGNVLKWFGELFINQYYLFTPRKFIRFDVGGDTRITLVNQLTIGGNFNFTPLGVRDYFEPRVQGRFVKNPASYQVGYWGSPDYRKKFIADYRINFKVSPGWDYFNWLVNLTPRWKVQENFLIIPSLSLDYQYNSKGYVSDSLNQLSQSVIIFGNRNVGNITTSLSADYIFSPRTSLAFRLRHYLLSVNYLSFYDLQNDGGLVGNDFAEDKNFTVNAFNIDMIFKWDFAPGSELLLVWKNAVYSKLEGKGTTENYFTNLENTFDAPVGNSLCIKLLYFIDWQQIKPSRKNKS